MCFASGLFLFIVSCSHSISQVKCSCKIGENESRLYPQGLWIKLFTLAASAVAVTKANGGNGKVERMFPEHLARSAHFTAANSRQLFNLSAYTTCFFRLPRNIRIHRSWLELFLSILFPRRCDKSFSFSYFYILKKLGINKENIVK